MNGVLVIDKPAGMTSHDVVNRVRRLCDERSIGHLGTLDPLATGVLPLVLGKLTRLSQFYTSSEKSYEGEIRFGFATDTFDAEGDPLPPAAASRCDAPSAGNLAPGPEGAEEPRAVNTLGLTLLQIQFAAARFLGDSRQMPPPFSAKKINGVPAYKLARAKKEVTLAPVPVHIEQFEITGLAGDRARFRARVSSGTYMRVIAHQMGVALGAGAHLSALRRTASAEFDISQAVTLQQLEQAAKEGAVDQFTVHPRLVLPALPSIAASEDALNKIRHGNPVNLPEMSRARLIKVFAGQSDLVCIAQRIAGTLFQPKVVLI